MFIAEYLYHVFNSAGSENRLIFKLSLIGDGAIIQYYTKERRIKPRVFSSGYLLYMTPCNESP